MHRSYLYAPGSRPDICRKALTAGADAVVFDLEDAVAAGDKAMARDGVGDLLRDHAAESDCAVHVRINRSGAGYDAADVRAVVQPGLSGIRLPKVEGPDEIHRVDRLLADAEAAAGIRPGSIALYPTIESALGVCRSDAIAGACDRIARLAFGSTDFLADISAPQQGDERDATLFARSQLVLASRVAGIGAPVDSVHTRVDDVTGLRAGATFAHSLGFFGKSLIHPSQIGPVNEIFTPTDADLARARLVLSTFARSGDRALLLDGGFVDPAVVARARATVQLAESLEHQGKATR